MSAVRGLRFVVGVKRFWWSFGALFARGEGGGGGVGGIVLFWPLVCELVCNVVVVFCSSDRSGHRGG